MRFRTAQPQSKEMLERALTADPKYRENRIRQALVQRYYHRIHRLGAQHRVEELSELLGQ